MRILRRLGTGLAALAVLTILTTGAALAGNWAEVTMVPAGGDPPFAGEEAEVRFTLLQHGITPVESGTVEVVAWLPTSGERVAAEATSLGDGEWSASLVFPSDGDWQLRVTHGVFYTPEAAPFSVGPAPALAWLPATAAVAGFAGLSLALVAMALVLARPRELRTEPLGAPHGG